MKGGSEAKNTAIAGSDIDVVVVISDFDSTKIDEYCATACSSIEDSVVLKKLRYGVGITVKAESGTRNIDILFTGDPEDNRHGNPDSSYMTFHTLKQVDYIRLMKSKHPRLHQTIVDIKNWAQQQSVAFSSYYMELLCIRVFEELRTGYVASVLQSDNFGNPMICPITMCELTAN